MRLQPVVAMVILVALAARLATLAVTRPIRVLEGPAPLAAVDLDSLVVAADGSPAAEGPIEFGGPLEFDGPVGVQYQWLDPEAAVIVDCGADGAPGRRLVDDNLDGSVDDRAEMGATGSDDVCRAVTASQLSQLVDRSVTHRVLQRGAFVPTTRDHAVQTDLAARAVVSWPTPRADDSTGEEHLRNETNGDLRAVDWSQVIDLR